ncbi:MAG: hypothetical protein HUK14_10185 [Muribaculaceae bacterium]|nr:hypothetical protein [Muribaculaceae bacterium]
MDRRAQEYRHRFVETGVDKGYERSYLEILSDDMYAHTAKFLLNKAHAAAYTILAYWISLVRTYGVSRG